MSETAKGQGKGGRSAKAMVIGVLLAVHTTVATGGICYLYDVTGNSVADGKPTGSCRVLNDDNATVDEGIQQVNDSWPVQMLLYKVLPH